MKTNAVFVKSSNQVIKILLKFWPNDSILNQVCCVLIEFDLIEFDRYVEIGIQHFKMYSLYVFNKMSFWPDNLLFG